MNGATVRIWPGGSSAGFAGYGSADALRDRQKRGTIKGWSIGAHRRLLAWLWSVDARELAGVGDGWALTLTVGETPATAADWHSARRAFHKRLERAGVTMQHWVVEWTRKGRPHLHMAAYGPGDLSRVALVAWLEVCDAKGWPVLARAQHIVPISGLDGWLQYVSKHASRGIDHYQRQGAPEGWEKTGRLWGSFGEWPVVGAIELELHGPQFYRYRRLMYGYQRRRLIALGVKPYRAKRIGGRARDQDKGAFMGVSGWIPEDVALSFVDLASEVKPVIKYDDYEGEKIA